MRLPVSAPRAGIISWLGVAALFLTLVTAFAIQCRHPESLNPPRAADSRSIEQEVSMGSNAGF